MQVTEDLYRSDLCSTKPALPSTPISLTLQMRIILCFRHFYAQEITKKKKSQEMCTHLSLLKPAGPMNMNEYVNKTHPISHT